MPLPTPPDARQIEEASLNAWPCLQQLLYDGWLLRFAGGYTRRANSINPLYPGSLAPGQKIARCEQIYRSRQLAPVFKVTPFVQPANLDDSLARAGYQKQAPTSVQWLDLADLPALQIHSVKQWRSPAGAWVADYVRMNRVAAEQMTTLKAILQAIVPPTCFVSLRQNEQAAACGLGVLEGHLVGLFDLVTEPVLRQQGWGTNLILTILGWAKQRGARWAYLQVMLDNRPALNLYANLGFVELYRYWYRVPPTS